MKICCNPMEYHAANNNNTRYSAVYYYIAQWCKWGKKVNFAPRFALEFWMNEIWDQIFIWICKKCSYILKENLGQCASIELFTSSQTSQQQKKKRILNCTYFLQFVTTWCDQAAKRGKGRGFEGWEVDQTKSHTYPLIELFNPIYPPISIALNQDWVCCFVWCFRFLTSL